jgi:hypothetical protein
VKETELSFCESGRKTLPGPGNTGKNLVIYKEKAAKLFTWKQLFSLFELQALKNYGSVQRCP